MKETERFALAGLKNPFTSHTVLFWLCYISILMSFGQI